MRASCAAVVALCLLAGARAGHEESLMLQLSEKRLAPKSGCAPLGDCIMYGDPHFVTFDGQETTFKGQRDFYIVKSSQVVIQGRALGRGGVLRALAISGPFINGSTVVIKVTSHDNDGTKAQVMVDNTEVLGGYPSTYYKNFTTNPNGAKIHLFHDEDLSLSDREVHNLEIQDKTREKNHIKTAFGRKGKAYLFKLGTERETVSLLISIYREMTAVLTMRKQEMQDGFCGNFNYDATDDTQADLVTRPAGRPPRGDDNLFGDEPPHTAYYNCRTEVPTRKAAKEFQLDAKNVSVKDVDACAAFCQTVPGAVHFDYARVDNMCPKCFATCRCFPAIYGKAKRFMPQKRMMCSLTDAPDHKCTSDKEFELAHNACKLVDGVVEKEGCLDEKTVASFMASCVEDYCQTGDITSEYAELAAEESVKRACNKKMGGKDWSKLAKKLEAQL